MRAEYYERPGSVLYMPLPGGMADVWLRSGVEEAADEDGRAVWSCDEAYGRTSMTLEEIEADPAGAWEALTAERPEPEAPRTAEQRLDDVEAAVLEVQLAVAEMGVLVAGGE